MRSQSVCALCAVGLFLILLASPGSTQATTIRFTATDLNDTLGPGGDLWQYSYAVSGLTFPMNYDFSILFSPNVYRALENPPPPVTDWDILTLQPDPALPADGLYDAFALVDNASLTNLFTVSFEWLGGPGTTPGAQPFMITEFDAQGNFLRLVETGQTQTPAPVPELGTFVLLSIGLVGLLGWRLVVRNTHV
jgi:hypothetical protein